MCVLAMTLLLWFTGEAPTNKVVEVNGVQLSIMVFWGPRSDGNGE